MVQEIAEFNVDIDADKMEIDEMIYIPEELTQYLIVE
jgi:hypothetical protein